MKTIRDQAEEEIISLIGFLTLAKNQLSGKLAGEPEASQVLDQMISKANSVWNYIKSTETPERYRS